MCAVEALTLLIPTCFSARAVCSYPQLLPYIKTLSVK